MDSTTTKRRSSFLEFTTPPSKRSLASGLGDSKVSLHYSQPRGFTVSSRSGSTPACPPSPFSSATQTSRGKARNKRGDLSIFNNDDVAEYLPLEVFAVILRYCDAQTVVRCSRVCCSLYSLAREESIWRRLYFKDFLSSSNSNNTVNTGRKQHLKEASWKELYVRHYLQTKYGSFLEKSSVRCDFGLSYEVISYHYDTNVLICRSEVFKNLHVFKIDTTQTPASASCIHTIGGGRECAILCASSNGYYIAGGSNRGVIHIWVPETATKVASLFGHADNIISLRFCEDKMASGSNDGSVKIWSTQDWSCLFTLREEQLYPVKLNANITGDLIVCASLDFTCRVWDLQEMRSIHVVDESDDVWIAQVEVTQSCVVLLYFLDKKVTVWNVRTGETKILCHPRSVRCIATNDSATQLLSGGYDGCLRFWHLPTGTCFKCCRDAHGKRSIDFIRCNQWKAVTASAAGLSTDIKVWDMTTGNCLQVVKSNTSLELGIPSRSEVGILSDLFFGSNSIITISNEEANMRLFLLEVPSEKKQQHDKQLSMCLRQGQQEKPKGSSFPGRIHSSETEGKDQVASSDTNTPSSSVPVTLKRNCLSASSSSRHSTLPFRRRVRQQGERHHCTIS